MLGPVDEYACPYADCSDEDEAEIAVGGFVVAGGQTAPVFQLVEAALDLIAQCVDVVVDGELDLAVPPHRDDRCDATDLHCRPDFIGIVSAIGKKNFRLRPFGVKQGQSAGVIGSLAGSNVDGYGQACAVGAEMNFGRKPTSRAPQTLFRSPPFAPAAQWCARMTVLSII